MEEKIAPKSINQKRLETKKQSLENVLLKKKINKKISENKKQKFLRAEYYIRTYKEKIRANYVEKRLVRNEGKFFVPSQSRIFFVIRIKGINGVPPSARKILHLIRLKQINNGVFLRVNDSTIKMLKKIEPFVAYGNPSLKLTKKLLVNRGFGRTGKRGEWKRVFLNDERVIAQALVKTGVSTMEDLINEIYKGGSHFKEVNNFLWPFKLKSPKKGFSKVGKNLHVSENGSYGNWEETIDDLISKML
mmetsp:Transcript_26571/g.53326  ORF Transcript_26571/g.53326 Transcript_26571/m.53326 type:complete len:247 (-) Transcript_26571:605-1345(-)